MKTSRAASRERPALVSTLIMPCVFGSKITLVSYFSTMAIIERAKHLTDLLVCWMHRSGYSELTIELTGPAEKGLGYRMTLKSEKTK